MEMPRNAERQSSNAYLDPTQPQAAEIIHESVGAWKSLLPFRNRHGQLTKEKIQHKQHTALSCPPNKKEGQNTPLCFAPSPRRKRDSNPRNIAVQRFSRPPHSTTLPFLQAQRYSFLRNQMAKPWEVECFFFNAARRKMLQEDSNVHEKR